MFRLLPLQLFIFLLLDLPHAVVRPCTNSVQGLAALLVQGLSGCQPQQIVHIPPNFIEKLGLQQSLTPSRNNGFLNMFRMMQRKSLELVQDQVRWQHRVLIHLKMVARMHLIDLLVAGHSSPALVAA